MSNAVQQRRERKGVRVGSTDWCNIVICQLPDQRTHSLNSVIYTLQQNRLVANNNPIDVEFLASLSRNPGELVRVIEVCVQRNVLSAFFSSLDQGDQLVGPGIFRVQGSAWDHAEPLCSYAETTDVWNG